MKELLHATTAYGQIKADATRGELSHAMLVLFPDEKYLRPLLKECAKAVFLAEEGTREERLIQEESFSDCLFYPAAGEKLTAELSARVIEESALRPIEGEKKLFVLDCFHTVTPLVQNKLLKSLEEPPRGVYFLLGATASHTVLPTVLSRVKQLSVPPFAEEQIAKALKRSYGETPNAAAAAAASGGLYSVAETLLSGGGEFENAAGLLLEENFAPLCREIGEGKEKRAFFSAVKLLLRDALFYRVGLEKYAALNTQEVKRIARLYPEGALIEGVALTGEAERQIQFNANFSQALLTFAVNIRKEREKWQKLS